VLEQVLVALKLEKQYKTVRAAKGGVIMNKMPNEGMKQLKKAAPAVAKKMGYSKGGMKKTMGYKAGGVIKAKCGASYKG
jgi:predicted transcriptional regulator YheO|tara:strand:- start:2394 stop:2630 length:237 start_codon:yes stop_codon:yes gene_type:complete